MGFENGKLVRVVLKAQSDAGDTVVNTLHYDLIDSAIPGNAPNDPQTLADVFRDDVIPEYAALFTNHWSALPVEVVQEIDPQNPHAPRSAWTAGIPVTGTRTISSDLLPVQMCQVATLRTDHIGRRFRGRMFIPGSYAEADQNAGVWNVFPQTLAQALLDAIPEQPDLATGTSASVAHWCVYSRTQRAQNLDPYASAIAGEVLRTQVHWLRSRGH